MRTASVSPLSKTVAILDLPQATVANSLAFRQFNGLTLLEWAVRRLRESTLLDNIVITGSPQLRDRVLAGSLCGARWLPSINASPLARANEIAERTDAEWLLFASPTCPFIDPTLLDRLVASAWSHPNSDYVGFYAPNNPQLSLAKLGLVGELCHRRTLQRLEQTMAESSEPVCTLVKAADATFSLRLIPLPPPLQQANLKLNLESIEDWDQAYAYIEAVGDDVSWQRLTSLAQ